MVVFSFNNPSTEAVGTSLGYARASQECPIKEILPAALCAGGGVGGGDSAVFIDWVIAELGQSEVREPGKGTLWA